MLQRRFVCLFPQHTDSVEKGQDQDDGHNEKNVERTGHGVEESVTNESMGDDNNDVQNEVDKQCDETSDEANEKHKECTNCKLKEAKNECDNCGRYYCIKGEIEVHGESVLEFLKTNNFLNYSCNTVHI